MSDPFGGLTPRTPELLDAWRTGFRTIGDSIERDALMIIDSGLGSGARLSDRDIAEWRRWRPSPEETTGSVYLDSTTVVTAARLLAGERSWLTPLTLWDLATVAQRVVMCERIYYTGAPFITAKELNGLLGDEVFVAVERLDEREAVGPAVVYGAQLERYRDLVEPLVYGHDLAPGSYWADAVAAVAEAWSVVVGRPVDPAEAMVPCAGNAWFTPKVELIRDAYCEDLALATPSGCEPVLGDVTFRAYASQCFAQLLGLPYAPSLVRMPFRQRFCRRSRELEDRMPSVEALDAAYRELAADADLALPFFLAVALADARAPEDVWALLGDLRVRATRFRQRRWELDETLARGQVSDEARRLLSAVRSEALKLTDLLGFGYEVVAQVLGRVGRATPIHLPDDMATLAGIARANLPADVRERLWWWFFRPELRFLTEMRTQSRQMTNAMPQLGRVFGLPPSHDAAFRRRFAQLAPLSVAE